MKNKLLVILLVVVTALAVFLLLRDLRRGGGIAAAPLPASSYLASPTSLEGGTYQMDATILHRIVSAGQNNLFLLRDDVSGLAVPVVMDTTATFHPNQKYVVQVQVRDGLLVAVKQEKR